MIGLVMFRDLEPQASCSMCGVCCEAIALPIPHENLAPNSSLNIRDKEFMYDNFVPMSEVEASRINPNITLKSPGDATLHFYSCKQYDVDSKKCNAHENRPHVCSGFPWYGRSINNMTLTRHMTCSYWADVPVEHWPAGVDI